MKRDRGTGQGVPRVRRWTEDATLIATVMNLGDRSTRAARRGGPTRLKSNSARRYERCHALARCAGLELARDPLGNLVAIAASAGDLGPAVALAALRAGTDHQDRPKSTGTRRTGMRLSRVRRGALSMGAA
jgi:hypothetical protein